MANKGESSKIAGARVRMVDIARKVGVSRAAVSYVLNGSGKNHKVSPKTAATVRRIAQRLNYHPNHSARQLAGRTRMP